MLYSRAGDYPRGMEIIYAEGFSPNTPAGACPRCHGLGRIYDVTERSMVPDDTLTIRERAIASWPPAWHGQNLRDILVTLGYDVDRPWRELPKKDRDWILYTEETPTVPVYAGYTPAETRRALKRKEEPSYMGTFTGARQYVLETFAKTESAAMKRRVARFLVSTECPVCHGKRLKPGALKVKFASLDIAEMQRQPMRRLMEIFAPVAQGRRGAGTQGGEEHPEKIGKGGDAADRAARGGRAALLLEGDRGREAVDRVHLGDADLMEESAGVRGHALEVAPLGLGVESAERER
jgi:excinuclease ABC subunit A